MPASIRSACKHTPLPGHIEGLHGTPMLARCGSAGPGRRMLGLQEPWSERDQGVAARRVRQADAANTPVSLLFAFCGGGVWACQGWDTVVGIWGDWAGVETRGDAVVVTRDPVCDNAPMNACMPALLDRRTQRIQMDVWCA